MSILKRKVALALKNHSPPSSASSIEPKDSIKITSKDTLDTSYANQENVPESSNVRLGRTRSHTTKIISGSGTSYHSNSHTDAKTNKNIVKNYARAIVNFTLSDLSLPYLCCFTTKEGVDLVQFRKYFQENKEQINSIKNLRDALICNENEDKMIFGYKKVFKAICEVFVKDFSTNWIYSSKLNDKFTHLRYRFKILRRVRNPEYFTYLEDFNKTH